jgi:threonylcarbamoyladenosine tRNA methylthiotransferase MtaB
MAGNRAQIETFGCRLNIWESEVMRRHADAAGLTNTIIVNTCAVTAQAEKQARQKIRQLRRQQPGAVILVTGCAAQIAPQDWADMPEVDQVLGNHDKLQAASWQQLAQGLLPARQVSDIAGIEEVASHLMDGFEGHTRAFLQVQQGCDHRCTFCIIPYGRGPSRSVGAGAVIDQVRALVAGDTAEIVLSGVDLTSWGQDLPGRPRLGRLVRQILAEVPELPRLRLSSIDPAEPDAELMAVLAEEERLMPHLHLSVQHGDDLILKRMKRRHLSRDVLRFCEEARRRRPDVVFGADMIAGFPTETGEAHQNSLSLIAKAGLTHLHIFSYSPRAGTPAARLPQLPPQLIKQRTAELRQLGDRQRRLYHQSLIGDQQMMLVEKGQQGYLPGYAKVTLTSSVRVAAGAVLPVQIRTAGDDGVTAVVVA